GFAVDASSVNYRIIGTKDPSRCDQVSVDRFGSRNGTSNPIHSWLDSFYGCCRLTRAVAVRARSPRGVCCRNTTAYDYQCTATRYLKNSMVVRNPWGSRGGPAHSLQPERLRILRRGRTLRRLVLILTDVLLVASATVIAVILRGDFVSIEDKLLT